MRAECESLSWLDIFFPKGSEPRADITLSIFITWVRKDDGECF